MTLDSACCPVPCAGAASGYCSGSMRDGCPRIRRRLSPRCHWRFDGSSRRQGISRGKSPNYLSTQNPSASMPRAVLNLLRWWVRLFTATTALCIGPAGIAARMYCGRFGTTAIHLVIRRALPDVSGIDSRFLRDDPHAHRMPSPGRHSGRSFFQRLRRGDHGDDQGSGRILSRRLEPS